MWQKRLQGNYSASPLLAGGNVYFLNERGTTTVVKAGTTFKEISRNAIGGVTQASLAADGAIYLRNDTHLFKIAER